MLAGNPKILEHLNAINEFLKSDKVYRLGIPVSSNNASTSIQLLFQTSKMFLALLDVKNLLVHQV
ncbi:hypothetical protein C5167_023424 [Papaver somniferum]|uniref:Uncharacterized protein n=1 Tax=Papaver somniferum TaxID=3469 RepID=A0A4Y7JNW4_PAPSO|nr:hypothetical protein C5167_023424 [Papaver somniferum]